MKKKLNIIDFVKFISSIIVVAIHTTHLNSCENIYIRNLWNSISILAVPFFFISTGYLSFMGNDKLESNKIKIILKKFIKLYIIWTIVYMPITIGYNIYSGESFIKSTLCVIRSFLFIGENYNSWPLWYLLSSIYGFIILYILSKKKLSNNIILLISSLLLFFGFTITILNSYNLENIPILCYFNKVSNYLLGGSGRLLYGIGYIYFGIHFANNIKKIPFSKLWLIISLIILLLVPKNYKIIASFPFILLFFKFIINIQLNNKLLNYKLLRTMSTVTYFTHMIFYTGIVIILNDLNYRGLVPFLITLSLTWICGIIYYKIKNKKMISY